jgi:hypothetical protein
VCVSSTATLLKVKSESAMAPHNAFLLPALRLKKREMTPLVAAAIDFGEPGLTR